MFKSRVYYRVFLSWNSQRGRLLSCGFSHKIYVGFIPWQKKYCNCIILFLCILWDLIAMGLVLSWWRLLKKLISRLGSRVVQLAKFTWGAHAGSWRVKCQTVFRESLHYLANSWVTCETLYLEDYKCDLSSSLPYYIYSHYPQNCKGAIQKKTLEKFLQHTHLVRESYTSLSENSFVTSSPFPLPLLCLKRSFVPKHNLHLFKV